MRVLIGYGFEEESHDTMYEKTLELMKAYKVTFYDAAYHSVAIKRSGTLITADASYYRKTSRVGNVALLGEWSSQRLYS
jgi:predicted nucleic acid-binding protein